ncbi:phospholipase A2 [Pseudozyma hubeiensis SY62]|uniref:Lysophospholipase n=1 Tax=Pseudozyma hubeiensis (strain SY62) TaxID=1305764 RepID=R9PC00_PSEHS|nr:phospholipase A2 [Pseudozyma hubeiensis SY62]GAC98891.1 phospholipase A2 [Pseudozyma hubeiensis SY62]
MPVLTSLRQSPTYLYVKVYCLCALVTLFQAAPVSSRIPQLGQTLQLSKYRLIRTRLGPRIVPVEEALPVTTESTPVVLHADPSRSPNEVIISSDVLGPGEQGSIVRRLLRRWSGRAKDLAHVKRLLSRDAADVKAYPELDWDANVRRSSALHPEEIKFLRRRQDLLSSHGRDDLKRFLELPATEQVHPCDVPLIALGGSGGGYRAMYGFAGVIAAAKRAELWDCLSWAGGVSGSCWTLAAYYTIACQDAERLVRHYLAVASELAHPMSVHALDTVARSSRGVYFLLGPLVRKAQAGIVGLGIMDLYATLTTTYQFLSREPIARLSRASFQFSKVWSRSGISSGHEPLPIFTAVRVAPRDAPGVRPRSDSSLSKGQPPKRALTQHQTAASKAVTPSKAPNPSPASSAQLANGVDNTADVFALPAAKGYFQWFEATPLEVGSADVQGYIPTWAWGRPFVSGRSLNRRPEGSLSLLLGQCTSAPAGPLTGYISALLASLPKGTVMSRILHFLNNFVRMKRWERRWGNPIRAGDEPNPFYGLNVSPVPKVSDKKASSPSILGIGVDILHTPRLRHLFQRRRSRPSSSPAESANEQLQSKQSTEQTALEKVAKRILCESEWNEYQELSLRLTSESSHLERYIANRWCAKEAAYKALYPKYMVSWKDLCVRKHVSSSDVVGQLEEQGLRTMKPALSFSDEWRSKHPDISSIPKLHLSLSHDGEYVVANVLAEESVDVSNRPTAQNTSDWSELRVSLPLHDSRIVTLEDGPDLQLGKHGTAIPADIPARRTQRPEDDTSASSSWESQGRIRLMDSGMSNNLPNHILARKERSADIIIAFDASSDVQAGSAMRRIHNFADDCQLTLTDQTHLFEPVLPLPEGQGRTVDRTMEQKFLDQYARVLQGTREEDGSTFWLIYCPLLPNPTNPAYDPSTSPFSNSYNLVWTPAQVKTLLTTSEANLELYALQMVKQVMCKVYYDKKTARLASQSSAVSAVFANPSRDA